MLTTLPRSLSWDPQGPALVILDQTRLPGETVFLRLTAPEAVFQSIRDLQVRGAPAIGIAGAWGLVLGMGLVKGNTREALTPAFEKLHAFLATARPTAVNLKWALDRLSVIFRSLGPQTPSKQVLEALVQAAATLQADDETTGLKLGQLGLTLLAPGWGLMTLCNPGAIATAGWGTALAPVHLGQTRGHGFRVFACETRPLFQGSRLTAWELQKSGVDVTVICDSAAASVLATGKVQAVVVGCDRVAANGDAANKIGTLGLAVLARYYRIPFYVFSPWSTIDLGTPTGESIPIEERNPRELDPAEGRPSLVPEGVKVSNPAFDVTPAELITALVTDRGIVTPPFGPRLQELSREGFHG